MKTKTIVNRSISWYIMSGPKHEYDKYKIQTLNEKMKNGVESIYLNGVSKLEFEEDREPETFNCDE